MSEETSYNPLGIGSSASRRKCLLFAVPALTADLELLDVIVRPPSTFYSPDFPARLAAFRAAIEIIERAADGGTLPDEEARAREAITDCKEAAVMDQDFETAVYFRDIQDILRLGHNRYDQHRAAFHVAATRVLSRGSLAGHFSFHTNTPQRDRAREEQRAVEARKVIYGRYLVDVFGPVPSTAFSSDWRTDTAIALARTMYEARDFSAMPILADALQDAGCDNEDVLNHCRDANATHIRGCWVVDLVLGKE